MGSVCICAGLISAIASVSRLVFECLQVRFSGPAQSFTNCQLLMKELALSTGQPLRSSLSMKSVIRIMDRPNMSSAFNRER